MFLLKKDASSSNSKISKHLKYENTAHILLQSAEATHCNDYDWQLTGKNKSVV